MYRAYFGISEKPFSITPDPRFLYLSDRHREGLAHLLYGVGEGGGFVQLTGEVGTGKTTLYRSLLTQAPAEVDVALVLNPKQTAVELIASICDELHIDYPRNTASTKVLIDLLNQFLLEAHAAGRRTVLIIDEAQNLDIDVLEQLRLLTNLETPTRKLLQIILIGQPELQTLLARPELRQLAQRITARYHLTPLSRAETEAYIQHRLRVAGFHRPLFTRAAVRQVYRLSSGVPRLINVLCERALIAAYVEQRDRIGAPLVRKAAAEVRGEMPRKNRTWVGLSATAALVALLIGAWHFGPYPPLPAATKTEALPVAAVVSPDAVEDHAPVVEPALEVAEVPATVPMQSAAPELGRLLQTGTPNDGPVAFAGLFRRWGLEYSAFAGDTACARAAAAGLRCLFGKGTWNNLLHYDHPAVLELRDSSGTQHQVVLSGITDTDVILELADGPVTVPRSEVDRFWFGSYILLWKPPPLSVTLLGPGSIGPDVAWLRSQLDRVEGKQLENRVSAAADLRFDDELRERVMQFQRMRGLPADGIAGQETLIQLIATIGDPSVPTLSGGRE